MIRTLCTLSKFANNTKLGGVIDVSDACAAIQRVLDRLERWANRKLMFNKGKSQVLQLELEQPPAPVYAVSSPDREQLCRKTSCGPWRTVSWTYTSNACCLTAKKVNSLLGCIMKSFVSRSRKMFLLHSALVRNIWCARSSPGLSSSTDWCTHWCNSSKEPQTCSRNWRGVQFCRNQCSLIFSLFWLTLSLCGRLVLLVAWRNPQS